MRTQGEVVVLLSREPRQVENNDELDAAFVLAAELQELLQLGAIGGLRALAFLAETRDDLNALTLAVFLTALQLPARWSGSPSSMRRLAAFQKQFDDGARHDIRVVTHAINFLVCQIDAVVPQQLATALDRGPIDVGRSDLFHRFPHRICGAIT